MAQDIFYSHDEKILFYIAGYTDNSYKVEEIKRVLNDGVRVIEKLICSCEGGTVDTREICTIFVEESRRYKYCRVFYVTTDFIPEQAYVIGNGYRTMPDGKKVKNEWTMREWLKG